jgi:hypothetical protein
MKQRLILSSLIGLSFASTAFAQPFYALVEGGVTQAQLSLSPFQESVTTWNQDPESVGGTVFHHQSNSLFRLGAGYQISERLSVEASYDNLGQYDAGMKLLAVSAATSDTAQMNTKEKVSISGLSTRLIGNYPLTSAINLLAGAGLSYLNQDKTNSVSMNNYAQPTQTANLTTQAWQWSPTLEIGASYTMTEKITARAWYSRYFNAGNTENLTSFDIDALSAGVILHW